MECAKILLQRPLLDVERGGGMQLFVDEPAQHGFPTFPFDGVLEAGHVAAPPRAGRADQHQALQIRAMLHCVKLRDDAAHGAAGEHEILESQRLKDGEVVLQEFTHLVQARRLVRFPVAAQVHCDHPIAPGKMHELRPVEFGAGGRRMKKDDRLAPPGLQIVDPAAPDREKRHVRSRVEGCECEGVIVALPARRRTEYALHQTQILLSSEVDRA
jgi:hypothetical protein